MNPRERALSFWRHGSGVNTDELRDLVARYMPVTDGEPIVISQGNELDTLDALGPTKEEIVQVLDAILDELKAIHKELQDGG